jgi:putative membrane protein
MNALAQWRFDPGVVMALAAAGILYSLGLTELWSKQKGRGVRPFEAACFWIGLLSAALALLSPIHFLSETMFAMHMTQHEILILIAAPLICLGRPGLVWLSALPKQSAAALAKVGKWKPLAALGTPIAAWLLHAAALWIWHIPAAFNATAKSEFAHAAQHISFFATAILFWWAVMHHRHRRVSYGFAVLYMFTTAMHSGLLGALLTLARAPWYSAYSLADQQIGGLIMWIPAGLVYVIAGLAFLAGWMREADARVIRAEAVA